jgi:hypothetical protein
MEDSVAGAMIQDKSAVPAGLAHVPAKWIRFADKDMRQP